MKAIILSVLFLTVVSAGTQTMTAGDEIPPDDNPRIDPNEIIAPPMDYKDSNWTRYYEWAENPETIDCHGMKDCESYKANQTAERGIR